MGMIKADIIFLKMKKYLFYELIYVIIHQLANYKSIYFLSENLIIFSNEVRVSLNVIITVSLMM